MIDQTAYLIAQWSLSLAMAAFALMLCVGAGFMIFTLVVEVWRSRRVRKLLKGWPWYG